MKTDGRQKENTVAKAVFLVGKRLKFKLFEVAIRLYSRNTLSGKCMYILAGLLILLPILFLTVATWIIYIFYIFIVA